MKEDYLWNKTGSDPEIERLENVLSMLRYQETPTPALQTAKEIPFAAIAPKRKFVLAFAFAASVAVVAFVGFWSMTPTADIGSDQVLTTSDPVHIESFVKPGNDPIVETIKNTNQVPERKPLTAPRYVPLVFRERRATAKRPAVKKQPVSLTREEKYAYGQLLLALSITGSKLKIVQDRVNGVEDSKTIVTKNNR